MTPHILYEDPEILVCLKPAGIPTQTRSLGTPDMESLLKNYLHAASPAKTTPYLAVIHRLDQPVEGLLVFAKTPAAAAVLNRQLNRSAFGKHYLALLCSAPPKMEDTLENYLVKDSKTNVSRVCTTDTPHAKIARLHYKVIRRYKEQVLAEITLDTGRHHQIRVQMAALGCPVVGDRKYGSQFPMQASSPVLCLFAFQLDFIHPSTQKPLHFSYTPDLLPPECFVKQ